MGGVCTVRGTGGRGALGDWTCLSQEDHRVSMAGVQGWAQVVGAEEPAAPAPVLQGQAGPHPGAWEPRQSWEQEGPGRAAGKALAGLGEGLWEAAGIAASVWPGPEQI